MKKYCSSFVVVLSAFLLITSCSMLNSDPIKPANSNVYYSVTYHSEYGNAPEPIANIKKGSKLSAEQLPDLSEEGFIFEGWFSDDSFNNEFTVETAINANFDLYAKWAADISVYVSFNTMNYGQTTDQIQYEAGDLLSSADLPILSDDAMNFWGWYTDSSCLNAFTEIELTENITLYARWLEKKYKKDSELSDYLASLEATSEAYDIYIGDLSPDFPTLKTALSNNQSVSVKLHLEKCQKVTATPYNALSGCTGLVSIILPESLTRINDGFVSNCTNLVTVILPDSLTYIDWYCFKNCTNLTDISFPEKLTNIGHDSFANCSSLGLLYIPASLKTINSDAFNGCTNVSFEVSHNNTSLKTDSSNNKVILSKDASKLLLAPSVSGTYTIPNSVTTITYYSFINNTQITEVIFPESVTSINHNAFEGCTNLQSVTIPKSMKNIEFSAFVGCSKIKDVYYAGTLEDWCKINFVMCGAGPYTCNPLYPGKGTLYINGNTKVTGTLTIPSSITEIGFAQFAGIQKISSVVLHSNITKIYECAFLSSSITTATIESPTGWIKYDGYNYNGDPKSAFDFSTNTSTNASTLKNSGLQYYYYKE